MGRWTERLKSPLFGYAIVEGLIGTVGLVFHDLYIAVTNWAYQSVFPHTAGSVSLTIAKWAIAAALILPQSVLLGMTFPLMTAGALRWIADRPGRTLSILYFANSFGAAVGVLIAGFYLVEVAGLPGTILAASILNFVVAIGAIVATRAHRVRTAEGEVGERLSNQGNRGQQFRGNPAGTRRQPSPAFCCGRPSAPRSRRSSMRSPGSGCCRW